MGTVRATGSGGESTGSCWLGSSRIDRIDGSRVNIYVPDNIWGDEFSLVAVTPALDSGPVSFWVACVEYNGGDIRYSYSQIAAVALSTN
jgi:hypothetical protein